MPINPPCAIRSFPFPLSRSRFNAHTIASVSFCQCIKSFAVVGLIQSQCITYTCFVEHSLVLSTDTSISRLSTSIAFGEGAYAQRDGRFYSERRGGAGIGAGTRVWTPVHLLSAEEVKSLFSDVTEGLTFLVGSLL
jgi:hypothetical protein